MNIKVVANSTPLIALSRINRFKILYELFVSIVVPDAVFKEVVTDMNGRAGCHEVMQADWIRHQTVQNRELVELLMVTVDAGEAEAIALAKEMKADLLIIDDADGRRMAEAVNIPISGTVGLLLRYYRGSPDVFKHALDELIA